jgi:hypothetical protein
MQQHIDNPTVKQLMARMNPTPTPAQVTEKPETK